MIHLNLPLQSMLTDFKYFEPGNAIREEVLMRIGTPVLAPNFFFRPMPFSRPSRIQRFNPAGPVAMHIVWALSDPYLPPIDGGALVDDECFGFLFSYSLLLLSLPDFLLSLNSFLILKLYAIVC